MIRTLYTTIKTADKRLLLIQSALLTAVMMVTYILYCTKDSLMVHHIGPEAVIFARTYFIVPVIFLFFFAYTKLLNFFEQDILFNYILGLFLAFYLLFSFYLYPYLDSFAPSYFFDTTSWPPMALQGLELITKWPITLYYIVSELWVIFVLGVMTWQTFNAVNTKESAGNLYYFLQLISNLAIIVTGQFIYQLGRSYANDWEKNLQIQTLLILLFALIAIAMKTKLVKKSGILEKKENFGKLKLSLKESLKLMASSSKIRSLFLIIFCYGVCNSFLETTNRYYLKRACPSIEEYNNLLAMQTSLIGTLTIVFIFLGAYLSSQKKYKLSIVITPFILFVCTLMSFVLGKLLPLATLWPLFYLSILQVVIVKSSKYGLIDPVKEFVFISLDKELKNKGKAAVDGVSNRLGKTGGNLIQQMIFCALGGLSFSMNAFFIVIFLFALLWLHTTRKVIDQA